MNGEAGRAPGLLARLRQWAGTGCAGLLLVCLAVLIATLLLRVLAALVEALAILILAAVVAVLVFSREWPEEWSRHWRCVRDESLVWLQICTRSFFGNKDGADGRAKSEND